MGLDAVMGSSKSRFASPGATHRTLLRVDGPVPAQPLPHHRRRGARGRGPAVAGPRAPRRGRRAAGARLGRDPPRAGGARAAARRARSATRWPAPSPWAAPGSSTPTTCTRASAGGRWPPRGAGARPWCCTCTSTGSCARSGCASPKARSAPAATGATPSRASALQLPRQRARGRRLRARAGRLAAPHDLARRRDPRPQPLRPRAARRARCAAALGARARACAAAADAARPQPRATPAAPATGVRSDGARRFAGAGRAAARYALVVSRLAAEKGIDVAIGACRRAGMPLVIAGEGPERARLRALAQGAEVRATGRGRRRAARAACGPELRSRSRPRARPRHSGWRRRRRWRPGCRWSAAASARCRRSSSRGRARASRETSGRWRRRSFAGGRPGRRGARAGEDRGAVRPRGGGRRPAGGVRAGPRATRRRWRGDALGCPADDDAAERADHGDHGPGRLLPGGAPAREGLRGHGHGRAASEPDLGCSRAPAGARRAACEGELLEPQTPARRRSRRCARASSTTSPRPRSCPTPGSVPPRPLAAITGACAAVLEAVAATRPGDPRLQPRLGDDLRRGAREPAERDHAMPAAEPLRDREAGRARAGGRAARAPRPARELGDPLQPRVRAPARAVRDAQDQPRGRGDRARTAGRANARRARRGARLVVRRRRDGGRLADAPAGAGRRLRAGQRRRRTRWPSSPRARSPAWAWRPSATCASTSSSSEPRSARRASATRRRRASGSGGARGSTSPGWWSGWCAADVERLRPPGAAVGRSAASRRAAQTSPAAPTLSGL